MNKQEAIAALGGHEGARKTIEAADPGPGPHPYPRFTKEHALCALALSALDTPSDGWVAMQRVKADILRWHRSCILNGAAERAEMHLAALNCIDRELAARPAKEPGLTIAETEKPKAALCDETGGEDAEVEAWEAAYEQGVRLGQIGTRVDGELSSVTVDLLQEAVRIMRERGAALKRAEKERDGNASMCLNAVAEYKRAVERAEKAEAEVARLQAIVAAVKEATK